MFFKDLIKTVRQCKGIVPDIAYHHARLADPEYCIKLSLSILGSQPANVVGAIMRSSPKRRVECPIRKYLKEMEKKLRQEIEA